MGSSLFQTLKTRDEPTSNSTEPLAPFVFLEQIRLRYLRGMRWKRQLRFWRLLGTNLYAFSLRCSSGCEFACSLPPRLPSLTSDDLTFESPLFSLSVMRRSKRSMQGYRPRISRLDAHGLPPPSVTTRVFPFLQTTHSFFSPFPVE